MMMGETPWDSLTRDELLREVQTMAAALVAARSAIDLCKPMLQPISPFWLADGTGGIALEKVGVALRRYDEAGDSNCYGAFFRYADPLFFPRQNLSHPERELGWMICDACGALTMNTNSGIAVGTRCRAACSGSFRVFTWDDLRPGTEPR